MNRYYLKDITDGMANKLVRDTESLINLVKDLVEDYNEQYGEEFGSIKFKGTEEQAISLLQGCFEYQVSILTEDKPCLVIDKKDNITVFRNLEYRVFGTKDIIEDADLADYESDGIRRF
jgi:hypothetical protein